MSAKQLLKETALWALRSVHAPFGDARLLILAYHDITDARRFEEQMRVLTGQGHTVVSLDDCRRWLMGERVPAIESSYRPAVVLTFDDGFRSHYETVAPILSKHALPSTFFVATAYLGKTASWEPEFEAAACPPALPIMEAREVRDLSSHFEIGSHGHNHVHLSRLSPRQQADEIAGAKRRLEDLLGKPVGLFAYPYGDYTDETRALVAQAGFAAAVTTRCEPVRRTDSPLALPRLSVLGCPSGREFRAYLDGSIMLYWRIRWWGKTHSLSLPW